MSPDPLLAGRVWGQNESSKPYFFVNIIQIYMQITTGALTTP